MTNKKLSLRHHPLYQVFHNMKYRCYNKNYPYYHHYGLRGITVCSEWIDDVRAFIEWSEKNGYKKGLQIDRRDNNDGYSPDNCRFVTRRDNLRNRSTSRWWHLNGVRYESAQQAATEFGVSDQCIMQWCHGHLIRDKFYPPKLYCYSELKYNPETKVKNAN